MALIYCTDCGEQISSQATKCPHCGNPVASGSPKLILPAFLLCFFFGILGFHRFYVGKIGTGILQLITLGGCGLWTLFDLIMIIIGAFTDKEGNPIKQWT